VWSWDFVTDVTTDGQVFRCLTVKNEATHWCVWIEMDRFLSHQRGLEVLKHLLILKCSPVSG
jgi:hypothetical protein